MSDKFCDIAYEDYKGNKRFTVTHPAHAGELTVAAPDENTALVAAANYWGETWTRYGYYAYCNVFAV